MFLCYHVIMIQFQDWLILASLHAMKETLVLNLAENPIAAIGPCNTSNTLFRSALDLYALHNGLSFFYYF